MYQNGKLVESDNLIKRRDIPSDIAIGIALRKATRGKEIINMLHRFGICSEYNKILRIETQIANSVIQKMSLHRGLYIPTGFLREKHIYFAIDNIDFSEDTVDGKDTLHATSMAVYQIHEDDMDTATLTLSSDCKERSLKDIPREFTDMIECPKPDPRQKILHYPILNFHSDGQHSTTFPHD